MRENLTEKQIERLEKALAAHRQAKAKRVAEYDLAPNKCAYCAEPIPYNKRQNKFCSHSCAASHNNLGTPHNRSHGEFSKKLCVHCGQITENRKYCSPQCFNDFNSDKRLAEIVESGMVPSSPSVAKAYLRKIRGSKCEVCGLTEWRDEPVPLVMDHINGKPSDWRLSNLRLVCGNCNMQLPTFAGRNVGKGGGRPYRNKRYLEGKSW